MNIAFDYLTTGYWYAYQGWNKGYKKYPIRKWNFGGKNGDAFYSVDTWIVEANAYDNEYVYIRNRRGSLYISQNNQDYFYRTIYGNSGVNQNFKLIECPCSVDEMLADKKNKPIEHSTKYHNIKINAR